MTAQDSSAKPWPSIVVPACYMTCDGMRTRLSGSFGVDALIAEARTAPRRNNIAMLIRP